MSGLWHFQLRLDHLFAAFRCAQTRKAIRRLSLKTGSALVRRGQILGHGRLINPILQIEGRAQFHHRHIFEPAENEISGNLSARNQPVAVIAVLQSQMIRRNRVPKRNVLQRFKPLFNILNIFKNYHVKSVPDRCFAMQIYDPVETHHEH